MTVLGEWMAAACDELGVTGVIDLDRARDVVLELARTVAHGVERPAAPLTAFLVGLAAGRSADPDAATVEHVAAMAALAERFPRT